MDTNTKAFWESQHRVLQGKPPQHPIDKAPWSIFIKDQMLTKNVFSEIYDHCTKDKVLAFWARNNRIGSVTPEDIDWNAIGTAAKGLNDSYHREFVKHATGYFATGRNAKRWNVCNTDQCPRCGAANETAEYIIQCSDEASDAIWQDQMEQLQVILQDLNTHPNICAVICSRLNAWRHRNMLVSFPNLEDSIRRVVSLQDEAGW